MAEKLVKTGLNEEVEFNTPFGKLDLSDDAMALIAEAADSIDDLDLFED